MYLEKVFRKLFIKREFYLNNKLWRSFNSPSIIIHKLTREILYAVYEDFGIILTVGIYASNVDTPEAKEIKEDLQKIIAKYPEILQMHGFYLDKDINLITFDIIVDFEANSFELKEKVLEEIRNKYPNYQFDAILDADYSD